MLEERYKNDYNKKIGNAGEKIATRILVKKGYKIIEKNFLCRQGEIDIIAKKGNEYIFVEVKTRRNTRYGKGIDAVTIEKQKHIWNSAKYFLYIHNLFNSNIRFDVIEILLTGRTYYINHVKNVM